MNQMPDAKTMPPGPADAAALDYARELVAVGADRTADFWAALERRHAEATHPVPAKAPRRT
jgi:predicted metalloprotease with PDZ domain